MNYQNRDQAQTSERSSKQQRPEEQFVPEGVSFGLPNSVMMSMPSAPPPGMPNSVMREMTDAPGPDTETARFFGGDAFKSAGPVRRNISVSAGAYAPGRSFGAGLPAEGHELSHFGRREAVPVRSSLSVPAGTIQRVYGADDKKPEDGALSTADPDTSSQVPALPSVQETSSSGSTDKGNPEETSAPLPVPETSSSGSTDKDNTEALSPPPPAPETSSSGSTDKGNPEETSAPPPVTKAPSETSSSGSKDKNNTGVLSAPPAVTVKPSDTSASHSSEGKDLGSEGKGPVTTGSEGDDHVDEGKDRGTTVKEGDDPVTTDSEDDDTVTTDSEDDDSVTTDSEDDDSVTTDSEDDDSVTTDRSNRPAGTNHIDTSGEGDDSDMGRKAQIKSLAKSRYGAPDEDQTFGAGRSRWRISSNRLSGFQLTSGVLISMSKYYKAYCDIFHIDTANDVDNGAILGALKEAQSEMDAQTEKTDGVTDEPSVEGSSTALSQQSGTGSGTDRDESSEGGLSTAQDGRPALVRSGTPDLLGEDDAKAAPHAGQDAQPAYARGLINPSPKLSRFWSSLEAFRNTGAALLNTARAGVLRYNYDHLSHRVSPKYDPQNWTLKDSKWTAQVSPWMGVGMGLWNGVSGALNMISSGDDMIKHFRNRKAGQSGFDTFQSGLDMIGAAASSVGGFWSAWQNYFGGVGKLVETQAKLLSGGAFGHAAKAVPWLGMISGGASFLSGGSQFVRGANAWRRINNSIGQLNRTPSQNDPGDRNRNKLMQIFNQGKSVSKLNTWSGLMKTTSGALTAAGSGLTLGGIAPVGMAVSAAGAGLNAIKTAFDRGWKHQLRSRVVGEDYHIDWSNEKKAVRYMISLFNPRLGMRDKYVREIILRAHGSNVGTRTEAFKELKLMRARYLINIANGNGEFHEVAGKVIESMGIKRKGPGGTFADAAANILAEKLG